MAAMPPAFYVSCNRWQAARHATRPRSSDPDRTCGRLQTSAANIACARKAWPGGAGRTMFRAANGLAASVSKAFKAPPKRGARDYAAPKVLSKLSFEILLFPSTELAESFPTVPSAPSRSQWFSQSTFPRVAWITVTVARAPGRKDLRHLVAEPIVLLQWLH